MNLSVLLISDDRSIADLLPGVLSGHRFDVRTVAGIEEALQFIASEPPHITIVDLSGPGLDGQEACRAIRLASNVPILVLSALNAPSVVARLLDAGADDYLVKPVSVSVLMAHLRKIARRTGALATEEAEPAHFIRDTQPLIP